MKDCIDEFEIELDIDDRQKLYDYANCREILREDETWNKDELKGLGTVDPMKAIDEDAMLQIRAMDSMFNDTGLLQKTLNSKGQTGVTESVFHADFAAFQSQLTVPRRVLPVYGPGDVVRGHVILRLTKSIPQAEALTINFVGQATVSIRVYRDGGYHDDVSHEKYADETELLWERIGRRGSRVDCLGDDNSELLVADVDAADPKMGQCIREGLHRWPFEFTIPYHTSQSVPNLRPGSHHYCFVVYRLKAKLDAGKALRRGNIVAHKGLWVRKEYNIGDTLENFQSFTTQESLETRHIIKSGRISIKATLPRRAFIKGEDIPIEIEINNHSQSHIDHIWAALCLEGKFRLVDKKVSITKNLRVKGEKKYMENLGAGMCPTINWRLPWNFSRSSVDNNLMPVGELHDSKTIEINYAVVIKAKRGTIHRNLELSIPILIGSENSNTTLACNSKDYAY